MIEHFKLYLQHSCSPSRNKDLLGMLRSIIKLTISIISQSFSPANSSFYRNLKGLPIDLSIILDVVARPTDLSYI